VQQLLSQGLQVSVEYADPRRYRTSSWQSAGILSGSQGQIVNEINSMLAVHAKDYVRLVGVDPRVKKRAVEVTIHRPGQTAASFTPASSSHSSSYSAPASHTSHSSSTASYSAPTASGDLSGQVRQILNQGLQIALESADERHYKTSSWQAIGRMHSEAEVVAAVNQAVSANPKQYLRLIGIDGKAKKRVLETIIHRPNGKGGGAAKPVANQARGFAPAPSSHRANSSNGSGALSSDTRDKVRQLLRQGCQLGIEHADPRRYRTSSWQSAAMIRSGQESEAVSALESTLRDYAGDYVRLVGIDPKAKRRVAELVIHQPQK
jgi:carbon dioxide concentrating mechanism protein CcmM